MGGFYTSDKEIPFDELYCEECGDSDFPVTEFDSEDEDINVMELFGTLSGGWNGNMYEAICLIVREGLGQRLKEEFCKVIDEEIREQK